jgi:hypothetical protein
MVMDNSKLHQPQRLEDETYENYVARRKGSHKLNKIVRNGLMFWHSASQGTFRKVKEN